MGGFCKYWKNITLGHSLVDLLLSKVLGTILSFFHAVFDTIRPSTYQTLDIR